VPNDKNIQKHAQNNFLNSKVSNEIRQMQDIIVKLFRLIRIVIRCWICSSITWSRKHGYRFSTNVNNLGRRRRDDVSSSRPAS